MSIYCIIGSGRQGTAAGYDIIKYDPKSILVMADINIESANKAKLILENLLPESRIKAKQIDVSRYKEVKVLLENIDIIISAVPYKYNLGLTRLAIDSRTSMVDLGGNTEIVKQQLEMNSKAIKNGIVVVPDCGMGPGMNISMALFAMEQIDIPEDVFIWDGGLPLKPVAPWNYALFFHIEGLTNEYDGFAHFLKNGVITDVPCFDKREIVKFGSDIGELEAAVTCGGLSMMPWTYEGKLNRLENKTLRYKGHWDAMNAYKNLGLFSRKIVNVDGVSVVPRKIYHYLLNKKLNRGIVEDICIMRIDVHGYNNSKKSLVRVESIERYDKDTGFTAMEKWTGWHASIVAQQISNKKISPGAVSVEKAISGSTFYKEALIRNYNIKIKIQ